MCLTLKGYTGYLGHPFLHQEHRGVVLATWDIRSGNRPVVYDEGGFLVKAREMRVQSTRSILRMRSDHAPIFTKKRFYLCCVFPSIKQRVSFCFHALQEQVLRWMKPPTIPLVIGTLADLTRGKAELLAENALLRPRLAQRDR